MHLKNQYVVIKTGQFHLIANTIDFNQLNSIIYCSQHIWHITIISFQCNYNSFCHLISITIMVAIVIWAFLFQLLALLLAISLLLCSICNILSHFGCLKLIRREVDQNESWSKWMASSPLFCHSISSYMQLIKIDDFILHYVFCPSAMYLRLHEVDQNGWLHSPSFHCSIIYLSRWHDTCFLFISLPISIICSYNNLLI